MKRTTGSIPKRCAVAILAASLEISGVTAAILSLPIVAYAGNDKDNITINEGETYGGNIGNNITNNGTLETNDGNVAVNNGELGTNNSSGDVDVNNGTIETNKGNVDVNNGTIDTNNGTVDENFGQVTNNSGTVNNNFGGTVGGNSPENQYHSIGVSGSNITAAYSGFTDKNGTQYLRDTQSESYITLNPSSGYSLTATETNGVVTNPDGYSYQIFKDSSGSGGYVLMVGSPTGNQIINLSALGIISELIGQGGGSSNDDSNSSSESADTTDDTGSLNIEDYLDQFPKASELLNKVNAIQAQGDQGIVVSLGSEPVMTKTVMDAVLDKAESSGGNGFNGGFSSGGGVYDLFIPRGITLEQRKKFNSLLALEPSGTAGPMRIAELLRQAGVTEARTISLIDESMVYELDRYSLQKYLLRKNKASSLDQLIGREHLYLSMKQNGLLSLSEEVLLDNNALSQLITILDSRNNPAGIYEISHINAADLSALEATTDSNSFQSIGTYVVSTAKGDALVQIGLDDTEIINYTISSNDNVDFDMIHTYFKTIMRLTHSLQSQ